VKKPARVRLDTLLVARGLFETRQKAQAAILAGDVSVGGAAAVKSGMPVPADAGIVIKKRFPYVGRGALKLIAALDHFKLETAGKIAIDIGSSTGGFTQVLLERGASRVYAVDSGTNQLDWKIRSDKRVTAMENTNARYLKPEMFPDRPEIAAIDVSFISLTKILPPLKDIMTGDYSIVALIKPQFELERKKIGRRGLVAPEHRKEAVTKVLDFARGLGLEAGEVIESPVPGLKSGNVEYLALFRRGCEFIR
jgi:23S rRNA (cytidine1920-2'-O)/16S rRNA (cytidine1409-2'-O)-methyltransferase